MLLLWNVCEFLNYIAKYFKYDKLQIHVISENRYDFCACSVFFTLTSGNEGQETLV